MIYEDVFRKLQEKKVQYLVVGGIAINLYGILRATADLDIMLQLKNEIVSGKREFLTLQRDATQRLEQRGWSVDYLSIHKRSNLMPAQAHDNDLVVLAAAWLGNTRLIDNLEI